MRGQRLTEPRLILIHGCGIDKQLVLRSFLKKCISNQNGGAIIMLNCKNKCLIVLTCLAFAVCFFTGPDLESATSQIQLTIDLSDVTENRVSDMLVSGLEHGVERTMVHQFREDVYPGDYAALWDEHMRRLFSGRIINLLQRSYREPDDNGLWWDFENIDKFIERAKKEWQVSDIFLMPQWGVGLVTDRTGVESYTREELDAGKEILRQIMERYAPPGELHVKFWTLQDEWPGRGVWEDADIFAEYHAELFRMGKEINPEIKIGGPTDSWWRAKYIAATLKACPDLDFITWNRFMTGRADTPVERVLLMTTGLKRQIQESKRLSREIVGRELPVVLSSFGPNYRAWDPPDIKMATPFAAVFEALVFNKLAKHGAFAGFGYMITGWDHGVMGGRDRFMEPAKMQPEDSHSDRVFNVRPNAYVREFFINNIEGKYICSVDLDHLEEKLSVLAVVGDGGSTASFVIVNFGDEMRTIKLSLKNFKMKKHEGMILPSEYISSTQHNIVKGKAFLVNAAGEATMVIPPYSFKGFTVSQDKK